MEKWLSTIDVEESFDVPARTEYKNSMLPTRLHPQHVTLEAKGRAWAEQRLAPLLTAREMERVRNGVYWRLACHFWPFSTDEARSMAMLKYMHWYILFDDLIDDPLLLRRNAGRIRFFCGHLLHAMFGTPLEDSSSSGDSLSKQEKLVLEVGLEWWNEMKSNGMSLKLQDRFASMVISTVSAQLEFNQFRERILGEEGKFDLEAFVRIRIEASGAPLCVALTEYDLGIELDEEALASLLVKNLNYAISEHISYVNDIISIATDHKNEDVLNIVSLIHIINNTNSINNSDNHVPFSVALSQAWEHVKAIEVKSTQLAKCIYESPLLATKLDLQDYVEAILGVGGGNWTWSAQSGRYIGPSKPLPKSESFSSTTTMCFAPPTKFRSGIMVDKQKFLGRKLNSLHVYPNINSLGCHFSISRRFPIPCGFGIRPELLSCKKHLLYLT